jgi:hypothetical protein
VLCLLWKGTNTCHCLWCPRELAAPSQYNLTLSVTDNGGLVALYNLSIFVYVLPLPAFDMFVGGEAVVCCAAFLT